MLVVGHKESAPAVHIPKFRRPYHSNLLVEILTNGYALTSVPSPFAIQLTFSIVIGRDLRTFESLPNQIQYLIEPTMSKCKADLKATMQLQKYKIFWNITPYFDKKQKIIVKILGELKFDKQIS